MKNTSLKVKIPLTSELMQESKKLRQDEQPSNSAKRKVQKLGSIRVNESSRKGGVDLYQETYVMLKETLNAAN